MAMHSSRDRALSAAGLSLLYPGLGQALQGRRYMATWLAVDFTGLSLVGLLQPATRSIVWSLALALGLYAILDAYRHERHRNLEPHAG